ncbi:MAG TPA: aquaporin [Candidatus Saccharimonadales bacterium]|nr:aquaporin [Candidatus Saccharimonadales bacterium]
MFGRRRVAALVAEFLGTGVLTLLILSVQRSQLGLQYFVALAAGLAIAIMVFSVGEISGGYFNPAITLGLWTARKLSTVAGILYIIVQFLGAWAAFGVYSYYSNSHLSNVGGHYTGRILIAEAVGTAIFAFAYTAALNKAWSHASRAAYSGLAYTLGVLLASTAALGLLNPALALGIKAWVWGTYVLGPVIGAIIGVNLYTLLFAEPDTIVANPLAFSSVSTRSAARTSTATTTEAKKPVGTKKRSTSRKKK